MKKRYLLFMLLLCSCNDSSELYFTNTNHVLSDDIFMDYKSLLNRLDSMNIQGDTLYMSTISKAGILSRDVVFYQKPKNRIGCFNPVTLPIYACQGFKTYGINLCESDSIIKNKIRTYIYNPDRFGHSPSKPDMAIFKFIIQNDTSIQRTKELVAKTLRLYQEVLKEENLDLPLVLHPITVKMDTTFLPPPPPPKRYKKT